MLPTCPLSRSELVVSTASMLKTAPVIHINAYIGVHSPHAAFDDPQLCTCVLCYDDSTLLTTTSQLPFDYSRNTVRRFHFIILHNSADAFDNSDCADALLQIQRHPLTIL